MYQSSQVEECFSGLVGMFPAYDPTYPVIDASLQTSSSGLWLTHAHPLCTAENIIDAAPAFKNFSYPAWVSGTKYAKGIIVASADKTYRAKAAMASSTTAPASDASNWAEISPFGEWLVGKYKQAINNLMNTFLTMRKNNRISKSLLESQQVYTGLGNINDRIIKLGRFVGWAITLRSAEGLMVNIDKVGIQTDTPQAELNFYLYHSAQSEPIGVFSIDVTGEESFAWSNLTDCIAGYMRGTSSAGHFIFGYYEDDLDGQALRREMDLAQAPCSTCSTENIRSYNRWSEYVKICAIEVPSTALNGTNLFDMTKVQYVYTTNFGINLSITVSCDISEIVCRDKRMFANMFNMQLALEFLKEMAYSQRMSTINDRIVRMAAADIENNPKVKTFYTQYMDALDAMDFDLSGLNGACLPCDKRRTISRGAM